MDELPINKTQEKDADETPRLGTKEKLGSLLSVGLHEIVP